MIKIHKGDKNTIDTLIWKKKVFQSHGHIFLIPQGKYILPTARYRTDPWHGMDEKERSDIFRIWNNKSPWDRYRTPKSTFLGF